MTRARSKFRFGNTSVVATATAILAIVGAFSGHATAAPAQQQPGTAVQVPGLRALNKGHVAQVNSVSCASAGNCSAVGYYASASYSFVPFVASEVDGTWRRAEKVPGLSQLRVAGVAELESVSCASAGNCSAGGYYPVKGGKIPKGQAFVVSEVDGTWGHAEEVPGSAALNVGKGAQISSVSCASAGNCSAGGYYTGKLGLVTPLVVSEVGGAWQAAEAVPGASDGAISAISCTSVGTCSAVGDYGSQPLVVSEVGGTWQDAKSVPGIASLNRGDAAFTSVSCASEGNCGAGGYYSPKGGNTDMQPMVASEVNGAWRPAQGVAPMKGVKPGTESEVYGVSCASAGNCSAGGSFASRHESQGFLISETDGTWGPALQVPGVANLSKGRGGDINSVSCVSAGNCLAGGDYATGDDALRAIDVRQVDGTWQQALVVTGAARRGGKEGQSTITSVSCPSAGVCGAAGYETGASLEQQAIVLSTTPSQP